APRPSRRPSGANRGRIPRIPEHHRVPSFRHAAITTAGAPTPHSAGMRAHCILALLLLDWAATAPAARPVAFDLTPQGAIIVPVIVNGVGPVPFLVDTGSTSSVISEALAPTVGAGIVARTTLLSAAGQTAALVARIERLAIGEVSASGVLMTVVPAGALSAPDIAASGRPVQGVIGQDVLGGHRYTIDYRERLLLWHDADAAAPGRAARLDLESVDDRFLVRLPQDRDVLRL